MLLVLTNSRHLQLALAANTSLDSQVLLQQAAVATTDGDQSADQTSPVNASHYHET